MFLQGMAGLPQEISQECSLMEILIGHQTEEILTGHQMEEILTGRQTEEILTGRPPD